MATLNYWRNIYKSISGYSQSVTSEYVSDILESVSDDVLSGLQIFKPYTKESYNEWQKKLTIQNNRITSILHSISKTLNMNCEQAYKLFCNYLMFEYYGKIEDIAEITKLDIHLNNLLENIWHFYSMERKFLLKAIRIVIQDFDNEKHPYFNAFNKFVKDHSEDKLKKSFMTQLGLLTSEISSHNLKCCINLRDWIARNYAEQLELVSLITILASKTLFSIDENIELLATFKKNAFGMQPPEFYDPILTLNKTTLQNVYDLENITMMVTTKHLLSDSTFLQSYQKLEEAFANISEFSEKYPIISFSWCLLLLSLPEDKLDHKYKLHLPQVLSTHLQRGVLQQIENCFNKPNIMDDHVESIAKEAVWSYVNNLTNIVDDVIYIYNLQGLVDLLVSLLKVEKLVKATIDESNPIHKLFSFGLFLFPWDYKSITKFCLSLLQHDVYLPQVLNCLQYITYYTEESNSDFMSFIQNQIPYKPIEDVVIDTNVQITVLPMNDCQVIQCRAVKPYNYFQFLEDHIYGTVTFFTKEGNYCSRKVTTTRSPEDFLEFTLIGLELLAEILDKTEDFWDNPHIGYIIKHVTVLVSQAEVQDPINIKIVNICLKICTILLKDKPKHIIQILLNSRCLPSTFQLHKEFQRFAYMNVAKTASLLQLILQHKVTGDFSLLSTYLQFIKHCLMKEYELEKIQVPNLVFILHDIFPHHLGWNYSNFLERNKLTLEVLSYLYSLINICSNRKESVYVHCYNFCMETLVNHDAFIEALITVFRFSNSQLEKLMYQEMNWISGRTLQVVKTVRMCLCIILWMFNVITEKEMKATKFWTYFFRTGHNYYSILKIICDYINYKFDPILPKLACSLLKKISNDSSISMLAYLQMDNYQVQCMFLERLRDPLENIELKVTLLEMITGCLHTQNGMTAAFFNLFITKKDLENSETSSSGDSLIDYMKEYLDNIASYPENLKLPVQATILKLFHTLWLRKKTGLVKSLAEKNQFWQTVLIPFGQNYELSSSTFLELLDILALELFEKCPHKSLLKELELVLKGEPNGLCQFTTFIVTHYDMRSHMNLIFELLYSWKKFLYVLLRKHSILVPPEIKPKLFLGICQGFLTVLKEEYDLKIVTVFIDICLNFITQWKTICFENDENLLAIGNIFNHLAKTYEHLPSGYKEALFSIGIKTLEYPTQSQNMDFMKPLLNGVYLMITKEYQVFNTKAEVKYVDCVVWITIMIFIKRLLALSLYNDWIYFLRFKEKVILLTGFFMSKYETMPVAKFSIEFLNFYIENDCDTFKHYDFSDFFYSIKPPEKLLDYAYVQIEALNPSYYEEFWLAYSALIQLNIKLIKVKALGVHETILLFMKIHSFDMLKLLRLLEVTVEPCALKLISNILALCNYVIRPQFTLPGYDPDFKQSYQKSLSVCLDSAIAILLRPQILKFYTWDVNLKITSADFIPTKNFANIMDRVVEIILQTSFGMLEVLPSLAKMFGLQSFDNPYFIELWHDFQIPNNQRYIDWPTVRLGGVLCVIQYFCKIILQDLMVNKPEVKTHYMSTTMFTPYNLMPHEQSKKLLNYITLVHPDHIEAISYDKITSLQRFATSDDYSLTSPWLQYMNKRMVSTALEALNTVLACHILKAIKERPYDKQVMVMRRELCSELQFYHDFVRKTLVDQHKYIFEGNKIIRNKQTKEEHHEKSDSTDYLVMLSHWFADYADILS